MLGVRKFKTFVQPWNIYIIIYMNNNINISWIFGSCLRVIWVGWILSLISADQIMLIFILFIKKLIHCFLYQFPQKPAKLTNSRRNNVIDISPILYYWYPTNIIPILILILGRFFTNTDSTVSIIQVQIPLPKIFTGLLLFLTSK